MYRSSGAYHNSRTAGYTVGSGRSNDYSAKPVSSTSSVYSYKPSSSSIQPGTSATASLTGSRSPSASYITTGANRSSGELSSVNRDADPSRWYSGSGRTYDSIRSADVSGKPVVYSLSNTSQPSAATYTGSSTRPVTSTVRPAGSYGSVRASVSSQPTESSVRLKTQPIYTSSYSLKPFTVNSTATSGGSAHFSTPAGTGSTSVRDTFSARGTPRTIASYASERVSEANQPTREPRTSSYTVPARTYVNTRPTESRSASYHSSYPTSSSRPITTSSRPIPCYDQPVMSSSQPETSSSRPITSPSRPITSYTRPVTSSSRPITSSSQPVTSSTRVVSSTTLTGARNVSSADGNARDEAERVRCGRLGEGVSGRAIVISDREFRNNNKALTTSNHQKHAEQLTTKNIDLHKDENRSNHYTDKYEHTNLIVRRGQDFDVTVIFNRPYDASKDTVTLQFAVGYRPQESKGTIIRVPVSLTRDYVYGAWSAKIMQTNQESVRLQITSPADAVVGRCHFFVETKTSVPGVEKETDFRYQHPEEIIMLFNPWCKDDTVYLDQQTSREEYVLNDSGLIWMGTAKRNRGMPWNFGQFEDVSLNTCLWLLERGQLGTAARANPVRVTRCISAMANFNDQDGGVLFGRWDNDYPKDTTAPTAWSGSVAILEKFWQKKIVVKFAQCWVFSGLVTTLLRAIGIPTRSVTNFASAHDSDASMTVDFHFDEKGKPLKDMDDSVWNFHVWNESWFKRPDLPDGHDGWQAHDATPQETSFGVFRCGPASVKAIKQGEVYLPFDSSFVFAEVNGDRVFWEVGENGSMKVIRIDKKCIGKMISTKAVGSDDRDDVTHQYKHPEGSVQERRAVEMAYKYSSRKDQAIYGLPTEDVKFSFEMPDDVPIGKDVSVSLKMKNTTYKSRTVGGKITAMIGFYTGISCEDLKEEDFEITLDPWEERSFVVDIPAALYLDKCKADGGLKIYVKATVKESEQRFASYDTIDFQKPHINMEITRGEARVGQDFEVKVSFVNPLPVRISGGKWYIETSGANPKSKEIPNSAIVPEGKEAQATFKLTPYRVGVCRVSVTFRADMLSGVYGMSGVRVRE